MSNQNSIFTTMGATSHTQEKRADGDYYATHPSAVKHLLLMEQFDKNIWECACGEGHLSKELKRNGKNVYSTDIVNRGYGDEFMDFLNCGIKWRGDIITNPPYALAQRFVEKAINCIYSGSKVAMFLKLTFLESVSRIELWEKSPPKRIYVYSFRQKVARNGDPDMFAKGSAVCYAWFVWVKGNKNNPVIDWITKEKVKRLDIQKQLFEERTKK